MPKPPALVIATVWAYAPGYSIGTVGVFDQIMNRKDAKPCKIERVSCSAIGVSFCVARPAQTARKWGVDENNTVRYRVKRLLMVKNYQ